MPRATAPADGAPPPPGRASSSPRSAPTIDPAARVSDLSTANRQLVEIAKALALEAKVLILDEPTESLTRVESERPVREHPRDPRARHRGRLHLPPPARGAGASPTASRSCATASTRGTFDAAGISEGEILRLIIGRSVDQVFPDKRAADAEPAGRCSRSAGLSGHGFDDGLADVAAGRDRRPRRRRGQRPARVPARPRRPRSRRTARRCLGGARAAARRAGADAHAPASSTSPATATARA